jgi:branched-subunit amino acid aminotransferase/4-amino-4-deoxychorismate lyase
MSDELACLDGRTTPAAAATISVLDDGFIRGDGAFEVVRVYDGTPFALEEHLDRIERSAANLRLESVPRSELESEAVALLEARGGADFDGCLRMILTRGGRRLLLTEPLPPAADRPRLAYVTYAPTRVLDGVKSLSYAANMLCSRIAKERGFDEALMVSPHGRVLEAPTSSIFWVGRDGTLRTPPLDDHILASITRDHVMKLVDVEEVPIGADELKAEAREAFLTSTTREVAPVGAIEDRDLGEPGEVTAKVRAALRAHIEEILSGS